jgi:glycosyltransferase involved in cell wall biosynthesis
LTGGDRKPASRFAVVIPLYNHARFIAEAIDSVLKQTRPADEIIVIDDGSADEGYGIAARLLTGHPGAIVTKQPNAGAHAAINRAIETATADTIAILNSDDVFHPDKLARCEQIIRSQAEPVLIIGAVRIIDEAGATVSEGATIDWLHRARAFFAATGLLPLSLLHENFAVTTSNMVFPRSLWQRNGGFQPLRYCHDLDFLMASARHATLHLDQDSIHVSYRIHPQNTIKERLEKIRVEIAAVMVSALLEAPAALIGDSAATPALSALLQMIRAKNVSDLALLLAATYRHYPDRSGFFAAVTASEFYRDVLPRPRLQINVAIEVGSFDRGGLEKVVLDSAVSFRQRGINPVIISAGAVGRLGAVAAGHGIEVVQLPAANRSGFYTSLLQVRGIRLAMSHFSRTGYRVFRQLGIPNITFIHNVYANLSGDALQNFRDDDQYVDRYVAVSANAARYAVHRLGVPPAKVRTIPNGLILAEHELADQRATAADRASLGIAPDDYVFLNVASYNLHKAHYLMAEAMQIVLKHRQHIKIVCIGNEIHPPHVRHLRDYLQRTGLANHMLMPGYCENVAAFHKMSDAFLLPSFIEGWSIAMNEAMFHGKPMILSDTGGASEVIDGEDIGIIVPNEYGDILDLDARLLDDLAYQPRHYRTAPHLASAMLRFADNRAAWQSAGRLGRKKVTGRYDFAHAVDRYIAEIEQLAG